MFTIGRDPSCFYPGIDKTLLSLREKQLEDEFLNKQKKEYQRMMQRSYGKSSQ